MPLRLRSYTVDGNELTYDIITDVESSDPAVPGDVPSLATVADSTVTVIVDTINPAELDVVL